MIEIRVVEKILPGRAIAPEVERLAGPGAVEGMGNDALRAFEGDGKTIGILNAENGINQAVALAKNPDDFLRGHLGLCIPADRTARIGFEGRTARVRAIDRAA